METEARTLLTAIYLILVGLIAVEATWLAVVVRGALGPSGAVLTARLLMWGAALLAVSWGLVLAAVLPVARLEPTQRAMLIILGMLTAAGAFGAQLGGWARLASYLRERRVIRAFLSSQQDREGRR